MNTAFSEKTTRNMHPRNSSRNTPESETESVANDLIFEAQI